MSEKRRLMRKCCQDDANMIPQLNLDGEPISHQCRVCGYETYLPDTEGPIRKEMKQ